jgi:plasmid stabilization system protein ParE
MTPEVLIGMLAELERIRELTLDLVERTAPRLLPAPPDDAVGPERSAFDLLIGARRAVLGNPAAARRLHDLLVAEGRRYAGTPEGAQLRDGLATSEAVENLRRVWETVSLNVLDGPAATNTAPTAWAELLADAVVGHGLDDSILARLRPEGFA